MNRKILSLLLIVLSIVGIIGVISYNPSIGANSMLFGDLYLNDDEIEKIESTRDSNSELITKIYFDDNELFYDSKSNKYYYSLVINSKTAYNPSVILGNSNINIAINVCEISDNIIENNKSINAVLYNEDSFFETEIICSKLPLLNISTDDSVINFLKESDETIEGNMKLLLFDNDKNRFSNYNGLIHVRGGATAQYDKKGYKITIKTNGIEDNKQNNVSLLSLPEGREFVLYAGYNDQERVRNVFCSQLWYDGCAKDNSLGINNGFYYEYVELFFNNEYWGLYALGYPVNEQLEQLDSNNINDNLYKKIDFWANEYEMNRNKDFSIGYELKTNKLLEEAWNPLINFYDVLLNENNIDEIYDTTDIDNCIDIFLFYYVIQGTDNVMRSGNEDLLLYNTYLISKEKDNKVIMYYCPWDFDRTFGKGFGDQTIYGIEYTEDFIMTINPAYILFEREDKQIKELILDKYSKLRSTDWSDERILDKLNNYETLIFDSGAYLRDIERWPNSSTEDPDTKLNAFKDYVIERLHYCDEHIYRLFEIDD